MSSLFVCPLNHPGPSQWIAGSTCGATECQISLLNLWIVNSFGQNVTLLTAHSMVEQLLGLIGLPLWPSTQNRLCDCPTTKNPDVPLSAGPNWLRRCKRLLTPLKKSDTASAGSNYTRLSLYHSLVKQQMLCRCVCVGVWVWKLAPTADWRPLGSLYKPVQAVADKRGHQSR